jgi:hypothetical protein
MLRSTSPPAPLAINLRNLLTDSRMNLALSTHPNPSLKKGGAPLRRKFRAHSPSLFQGGGQGVGTFNILSTCNLQY